VLALLLLGGEVIRPFAIAMSIGIIVGTYSSVFIAAPTLLLLEQRANRRAAAGQAAQGQHPKAKGGGSAKPKGSSAKPKGGSAKPKRGSGKGKRAKARA
jgi:predicted RND superfamily exporter protein